MNENEACQKRKGARGPRWLLSLLPLLLILLVSATAEASHFRHGNIDWRVPDPAGAPLTVEFTVRSTWRADFIGTVAVQFGDGTASSTAATNIGSGVDASGGAYVTTEFVEVHVYATAGNYLAFFDSCCRVAGLQGGTANGDFRVEATVSLLADGSNSGPPNMGVLPIQQLQVAGIRQIAFPIADPDGDATTCRFSTDAEAGLPAGTAVPTVGATGVQPVVLQDGSGGTLCVIQWDTNGAVIGNLHVMHIVLESTNSGVVSKTANDFLVEMVLPPPPICTGGGVYQLTAGTPFSITTSTTSATDTTLSVTGAPAGSTLNPIVGTVQASPASTTFAWTPGPGDDGTSRTVTLAFTDTDNLTGACFLNLVVGGCGNGIVEFGEDCDGDGAGNGGETAVCNATCSFSACGDGIQNNSDGEFCDDGNTSSNDGCSSACVIEDGGACTANAQCTGVCDLLGSNTCEPINTCGNGTLDASEICDDGNTANNDGCSSACLIEDGGACTGNAQCTGVCDLLGSNTCEPINTCGNGTLDASEGCDDGNTTDSDGCTSACLIENGGACTDDADCVDVCDLLGSNTCEPANTCGNGTLDAGESCDDGNLVSSDGCTAACLLEDGGACTDDAQCTGVCDLLDSNTCEPTNTCGNGTLDAGESCDDGNLIANDGCALSCRIENGGVCSADGDCDSGVCDSLGNAPALCEAADTCGNGFVDPSEGCDDGNLISNDGCSLSCDAEFGQPCAVNDDCESGLCDTTQAMAVCELPDVCGNGVLESGEGCDDGNLSGGDGCGSSCLVENGNACNATSPGDVGASSCISSSCINDLCVASNRCADGVVDPGEGCDDGNLANGDSCDSNCLIETGNPCSTDDSCASGICDTSSGSGMCEPPNACANGVLESGEGCDDGNTMDGDACSANCFIEDGVACGLVAPGLMSGSSCVSNFCDDVTLECTTAADCGDGVLDPGEGCDDGNNADSDGCNSFCFLEDGQSCNQTNPGSLLDFSCASGNCDDGTCEALNTCGNGILEAGEGCDDSNTISGDGCDDACFLEEAIACNVEAPGNIGDGSCASGLCNDSAGVPGFCAAADVCGNSSLDPGEGCDDGNLQTGDGCDQLCLIEDGMDCHASLGNSSCASDFCDMSAGQPGTCEPANTCGNGTLEAGEGCDDGNTTASDGCSSDCLVENGQLCNNDDQGAIGNASCESAACDSGRNVCVPGRVCGNTILESGEGCDDGNTMSGDGCSSGCKIERGLPCNTDAPGATGNLSCETGLCNTGGGNPGVCQVLPGCGNGFLEAGEGCDDGNANDGDGCSLSCLVEVGSSCNSDAVGITGDASCLSQVCDTGSGLCIADCGNGMAEAFEGCDDGNQNDGDGCTATCLIEPGGACTDDQGCQSGKCEAGVCSALENCGDGEIAANEGCDDGNLLSGDGCNQFCKIEFLVNCSSDTNGLTGNESCASGICDTSDGDPGICTKDENEDGFNDHLGLAGGGCQASGSKSSGWLFLLVIGLLLYWRRRREAGGTLNESQEGV